MNMVKTYITHTWIKNESRNSAIKTAIISHYNLLTDMQSTRKLFILCCETNIEIYINEFKLKLYLIINLINLNCVCRTHCQTL